MLKQNQYTPMKTEEQVCIIFAGVKGYLDVLVTSEVLKFEKKFLEHMRTNHSALLKRIRDTGDINAVDLKELETVIPLFIQEGGFKLKGQWLIW